jgi:hypothetical protein
MHMMHKIVHAENGMDPEQWVLESFCWRMDNKKSSRPLQHQSQIRMPRIKKKFILS